VEFYLGTHHPNWLESIDVPLFVSRNRLQHRRSMPRAIGDWALDSGAFTEVSTFGEWRMTPTQYLKLALRFWDEIGNMNWAAPMDWMCEPFMLAKTKKPVETHIRRTVINYVGLREMCPWFPFIPVIQGFTRDDYMRCIELYYRYRVELHELPLVGVGSVCRRQAMPEIASMLREISDMGIRIHAFGFKMEGVSKCRDFLESCDSMAWSFNARRMQRRWCKDGNHKNCANCSEYALDWRRRLLARSSVQQVSRPVFPHSHKPVLLSRLQKGLSA